MRSLFYTLIVCSFWACSPIDEHRDGESGSDAHSLDSYNEKTTITFPSTDSLTITADYYPNKGARKLILLFHQANFSRGEYAEIAPKLVEKGYACMAVDLRSGREAKEVVNETFNRALSAGMGTNFLDAQKDMKAAIAYAKAHTEKELVLWGSSYSATLVLIEGRDDPRVVKIIAFSPGIYFSNAERIQAQIRDYKKPVFVSCTQNEKDVLSQVLNMLPNETTMRFEHAGDHGSRALWADKPGSDSLMLRVLQFL